MPADEVQKLIERSEIENAQVWNKIIPIKAGDRVLYTPTNPELNWAAGERTALEVEGDWVKLKCGNIRLVAKISELTKI